MKTITTIIFTIILPLFLFADELKVDSCYNIECLKETIDTAQNEIKTTKTIESVVHTKSKAKNAGKEILKNQELAACWLCDIVDDLSDAIVHIFTGGLWNEKWGYYKEGGQSITGPYTVFDRTKDLTIQLNILRDKILHPNGDSTFYKLYTKFILAKADESSSSCSEKNIVCNNALIAKASAFVFVVGIRFTKNQYGINTAVQMSSTDANRIAYKTKSIFIISYFSPPGMDNVLDWFSEIPIIGNLTPVSSVANIIGGSIEFSNMYYRSQEMVLIISAFDLIKWSSAIDNTLPNIQSADEVEFMAENLKDKFIRPFYRRAIGGVFLFSNNNYGLLAGSALGMAAVCLNDYGGHMTAFDSWPHRWASVAHYHINNNMWNATLGGSLSKGGDLYGYSEGTHYLNVSLGAMLPYFRAQQNFTNRDFRNDYYDYPVWFGLIPLPLNIGSAFPSPWSQHVRNFNFDPDYDKIYQWHMYLTQPDGNSPAIDDSWHNNYFNGGLALRQGGTDGTQYSYIKSDDPPILGIERITEDYLVSIVNNPINDNPQLPEAISMPSGSAIFRNNTTQSGIGASHYLHVMTDITQKGDYNHQHTELGHFMITVDKDILLMDPPVFGDDHKNEVCFFTQHNVIHHGLDVDAADGLSATRYVPITIKNAYQEFSINLQVTNTHLFSSSNYSNDTRTFKMFQGNNYFYYIAEDNANSNITTNQLFFNGNGGAYNSSFSITDNHAKWNHPCVMGGGGAGHWGLTAETVSDNTTITFPASSDYLYNGDADSTLTKTNAWLTGTSVGAHGKHGRFTASISGVNNAKFLTKFTPFRCESESTIQYADASNNNRYGSLSVKINNSDRLHNFHYINDVVNVADTIINPFKLTGNSSTMRIDASSAFFSYAENDTIITGQCVSYANFRGASINNGDTLKYEDTAFIVSTAKISAYYQITGKFSYTGYVTADSGGSVVKFRIPDMEHFVPMVAVKVHGSALTSTYHDTTDWKNITVTFPQGTTYFNIQPAFPCMLDCYFPPVNHNIDSIFSADDGKSHTLGHKLSITQPKGILHITNGTRVDLCDNVYMRNRDTIIIEGECQQSYKGFNPCTGIEDISKIDNSSAIIVSEGSSLVLDSGSFTHLKSGGAIWVKQNGSLVIKNDAHVLIGDSPSFCGYGEIITEPGAYLFIEPNAHIEFARTIGDTVDRNLFQVGSITHAGVYSFMETTLDNDTILVAGVNPIAICDIDSLNPVKNREWGYANFAKPLAKYLTTNNKDTICPGEEVCIKLNRILNSSATTISVCKVDSALTDTVIGGVHSNYMKYTYSPDTLWKDTFPPGDHPCTILHQWPDNICFHFKPNTLHRIIINTKNDCGRTNDTVGYILVSDTPHFNLSVPSTACAGIGTLTVGITHSSTPVYYTFSIIQMPDTSEGADNSHLDSYAKSTLGYLPDTFRFDSFQLKSNRSYLVSLTISNSCGGYTKYGVVNTPFSAKIKLHLASTYNNPVGPAAFQLQGIVKGATSYTYSWSPSTYLSSTSVLNPVCMPSAPIQYVFTATNGTCTDRDTAYVKHNEWAYAGMDTELCYNQNVILGTDYAGAAFLGLVWHSANHTQYDNIYQNVQQNTPYFGQYFMHFMLQQLQGYGSGAVTNFLNNEDLRSAILKDANFITFYNNFITNNGDQNSFSDFENMLNANGTLKNLVENTYNYQPNSDFFSYSLAQTMFNDYANWLNTTNDTFSTQWDRLDSVTWTPLTSFKNYFNMIPDNTRDKYYRITVVDNTTSSIEYDQILVKRDSVVAPRFIIGYKMDSTAYFLDVSVPEQHQYRYSWNFGDGGYSLSKNPIHTFAHADTSFIVCLTIRDSCGTYTKCDTLKIDSSFNMALFGKRGLDNQNTKNNSANFTANTINSTDNYLSVNKPNPFSDYSIVEYSIAEGNHNSEIRISTPLGQIFKSYKLQNNKGVIAIDGSQLSDGIYYYSLVVDGVVVSSKRMLVQK